MSIILNPFTGQFDLTSVGAGGDVAALQAEVNALTNRVVALENGADENEKLEYLFDSTDFVLVVDQYIFTIPASVHLKQQPLTTVFEDNGSDFDEVTTSIKILANRDVQVIVPQTPDLRFNGKLIIS